MRSQERELKAISDDIARRQWHRRGPTPIADAVSSLMARQGYGQVNLACAYAQAWKEAAGPKLAEHSRAGNVRRGVLEVVVRNSAVLQELTFQKRHLLKELARLMPDSRIADVRFRVGSMD